MRCLDCPALNLPRAEVRERCCSDRSVANLRDTPDARREHPDAQRFTPGSRAQRRRAQALLRKGKGGGA
jgi:hypothetical protein